MSKVLLINGSPNEKGCTYTALKEMIKIFEKNEVESELLYLGKKPIAGCIACGKCYQSKRCVFDDKVNQVLEHLDEYQAIVIGSPVYYAGPAGQLCAFLDRLFYCAGKRMKGKLAASVVSCRRGGASAAFDRLNKYFGISNMHIIGSQYWNQVHGNRPEEVLLDKEGLQTMRTLALNFVWMLKNVEMGKQNQLQFTKKVQKNCKNFNQQKKKSENFLTFL